MNDSSQKNTYMEEVLQQQQVVAQELKRKVAPEPTRQRRGQMQAPQQASGEGGGRAVDVRITGFWRWKTVIVPPNVWVVHTRRGREQPMRVGLGTSFRFDPETDTFIVAPATMQTLMINARCIGKERQGILVQAYVQWIIDDFKAAYQKFDFSDIEDPTRIVNVQLREQAEASIKDKVATMGIDEVLADKSPIIEELTTRLRQVAEGQGLKIVTVQIKEAIISSTRLFENLQQPFREEQQKTAQLAQIASQQAVSQASHRAKNDAFELERQEQRRRQQLEQKAEQERAAEQAETERVRKANEVQLQVAVAKLEAERAKAELERIALKRQIDDAINASEMLALQAGLAFKKAQAEAEAHNDRLAIDVLALKRKVENDISKARIDELFVTQLPQVMQAMPKADKIENVNISGDGRVPDAVMSVVGLMKGLRGTFGS